MTPPPLSTIPDTLVHCLAGARVLTPEPRRILRVVADGSSLQLELDGASHLMLTGRLPPIQLSDESRASEMVTTSPASRLLGRAVKTFLGFVGTVMAVWETRRAVEPWEEAPIVTWLLVGSEEGAYVVERADIFL